MRRILCIPYFFALALLSGCTFGGNGVFPRETTIIPNMWLIHEEVRGTVVDLYSCQQQPGQDLDTFAPQLCLPVAGAQVALIVNPLTHGGILYNSTTDDKGNFRFKRRSEPRIHATSSKGPNHAMLTVTADCYAIVSGTFPLPAPRMILLDGRDRVEQPTPAARLLVVIESP